MQSKCPYIIRGLFFNLDAWDCREHNRLSPTFYDKTTVTKQIVEHGCSLKQLWNNVLRAVADSLLLPKREGITPPHASPVLFPLTLPCSQRCGSTVFPGLALLLNPCRPCFCLLTWEKILFSARNAFCQVSAILRLTLQTGLWGRKGSTSAGGWWGTPPSSSTPLFRQCLEPPEAMV